MGYFQVRYDSRVVNYDRRVFIRLATDQSLNSSTIELHDSVERDREGPAA